MAAAEDGPDHEKVIAQRHLVAGIERVVESKKVMNQSLFGEPENPAALVPVWQQALARNEERYGALEQEVMLTRRDMDTVGGDLSLCRRELEMMDAEMGRWRTELQTVGGEVARCGQGLGAVQEQLAALQQRAEETEGERSAELAALREELAAFRQELHEAARAQSQDWEERLRRATLIPIPRWASVSLVLLALAATGGLGWATAALQWLR
jgi:chromosome segregation ATPase